MASATGLEIPNRNERVDPQMNVIELPLSCTPEKTGDEFVNVLRTLVHKLSQPLTCLRGSVEVALLGEIRELECREVLEQSLEESHRMAQTLELLRDVLESESSELNDCVQPSSWRHSIEKSLQESMLLKECCGLQFVCDAMDEVWVKASEHALDTAMRRLLDWVIKRRNGRTPARIVLAVDRDAACLSVCVDGSPYKAKRAGKTGQKDFPAGTLESEDPELWTVRRTIERQGGRLEISRIHGTDCNYQFYLPMAFSEVAQRT